MIRDLDAAAGDLALETDILVVGGGTAGLIAAVLLRRKGRRVIVVESGDRRQTEDHHPLNEVVQIAEPYRGADEGRFRCLGGTSTRWGGALIPFLADDFETPAGWNGAWPIGFEAFERYEPEVARLFGLADTPYATREYERSPEGESEAFVARLAKWPPFRNRNVATLLHDEIEADSGPDIWLSATLTAFALDENGRVRLATAKSPGGRQLSITAKHVVLAAGAIESTRLLLLLDRQHGDRIFAPHDVLGRYFYDHLSTVTGRLRVKDPRRLNRTVGFRFEGSTMRNLRFEPTLALRRSWDLPCGFAHVGFTSTSDGGFDALRAILRRRQEGRLPEVREVVRLSASLPWLARAAWWRVAERRVLFPLGAALELHMVLEQEPLARNRIGLSSERSDAFGQALATIDWRIGARDVENAEKLTRHFAEFWGTSKLSALAVPEIFPPEQIAEGLRSTGGIYHPGGATRMGLSASNAVVDKDLTTFAVRNLSVLATSIFPTGGGANPTMMLLMAACRLADRLGAEV